MMGDVQIEALRQEFFRNRDRVWADTSMPLDQKQARVDALWREYDGQRRAIEEGYYQGEAEGPINPTTGRRVIFPRKRRRPWK